MGTIELLFNLNVGRNGQDTSPTNPLSRAYDNLLAHGRHHRAHSLCFYNAPGRRSNRTADLRWLGVFGESLGDRVILFPGFSVPIDWLETTRPNEPSDRKAFYLDHFTAEPARQRWHFTEVGRSDHVAGGRMPTSDSGMLFWFGLSVHDEQALLPVQKSTVVRHNSPNADADRRIRILRELEESAISGYISSDIATRDSFRHSFLHFTFMVGRPSKKPYEGYERLVPAGSNYLKEPLPKIIPESNVILHRHALSNEWVVDISTVWLPGKLEVLIAFTSPASL